MKNISKLTIFKETQTKSYYFHLSNQIFNEVIMNSRTTVQRYPTYYLWDKPNLFGTAPGGALDSVYKSHVHAPQLRTQLHWMEGS